MITGIYRQVPEAVERATVAEPVHTRRQSVEAGQLEFAKKNNDGSGRGD